MIKPGRANRPPEMKDDWPFVAWVLLVFVGTGFMSTSSPDHLDVVGVVGMSMLLGGCLGLYLLGLNRDRDV